MTKQYVRDINGMMTIMIVDGAECKELINYSRKLGFVEAEFETLSEDDLLMEPTEETETPAKRKYTKKSKA